MEQLRIIDLSPWKYFLWIHFGCKRSAEEKEEEEEEYKWNDDFEQFEKTRTVSTDFELEKVYYNVLEKPNLFMIQIQSSLLLYYTLLWEKQAVLLHEAEKRVSCLYASGIENVEHPETEIFSQSVRGILDYFSEQEMSTSRFQVTGAVLANKHGDLKIWS